MSLEVNGLQFGDFFLDLEQQSLLKAGKPVSITPKAFLLLKTLVENQGRVVEKSRLMETVWPDSFVEEGNLSFTINLLRKILGDSRNAPKFIETVPKRGYRFVAEVVEAAPPTASTEELQPVPFLPPEPETPATVSHSSHNAQGMGRKLLTAVVAVVILLALGVGVWFVARKAGVGRSPILSRPFSVEQLSESGNSENAAISPDGKYVAYSSESGGRQSVWLRDIETSENIQIVPPSADEYLGLAFSRSGKSIYFVRKAGDVHGLPSAYKVDLFSGIPELIVNNVIRRVDVAPDEKQIAFVRCNFRKDDFCAVFVAETNGSNERRIWTSESSVQIYDVRFSADGKTLAVANGRYANDKNDSVVTEIDIASGTAREMFTERFFRIGSLQWMPDGSHLLFAASNFREGKEPIWMVPRGGGAVEPVTRDAGSYTMMTLDATASKLVAVEQTPDFKLHVLKDGSTRTLSAAREFNLSPGGKIVYTTFDGEIWTVNREGGEQRQLTKSTVAESFVIISSDDRTIFFSSDEGGARHVWRMNADGTERKRLTQTHGGFPSSLSADGKTLFYAGYLLGDILKVPVEGGTEEQVNGKRFATPRVSPDGSYLAHLTSEGMVRKVAVLDLKSNIEKKLTPPKDQTLAGRTLQWSRDSKYVYYITSTSGVNTLWQHDIQTDVATKLADLSGDVILAVAVADDGSIFYIGGKWRHDVMLIRGLA